MCVYVRVSAHVCACDYSLLMLEFVSSTVAIYTPPYQSCTNI